MRIAILSALVLVNLYAAYDKEANARDARNIKYENNAKYSNDQRYRGDNALNTYERNNSKYQTESDKQRAIIDKVDNGLYNPQDIYNWSE